MLINSHNRWILITGALLALLSVAFGAFAAHGLKGTLDSYSIGIFETAARYQMYHGLGLCLCGLLIGNHDTQLASSNKLFKYAATCFVLGGVLFSGSLYLLALTSIKWLGMVTPLGGVGFIAGWSLVIIGVIKS